MKNTISFILASKNNEHFKSKKSQFEHEILFKPMVNWVCDMCQRAQFDKNAVILPKDDESLIKILPEGFIPVNQYSKAFELISENTDSDILLIGGDNIFADEKTVLSALEYHRKNKSDITSVYTVLDGRRVKCNLCWIKPSVLIAPLKGMSQNSEPEDWLNALESMDCDRSVYLTENTSCLCRIYDKKTLAEANEYARLMVIDKMYEAGVNIPCKTGVIISPDTVIGMDTTVLPNSIIRGKTVIGEDCVIGEGTNIVDSTIGDKNSILSSLIENSVIHDGAKIGPFVHIRPGSEIEDSVKLGNFVEIKSSKIGNHTSVAHLTYLGDSELGQYVNVGCGVVTANYDGANKHKTVIGDSSFIGCNTNFVPPVSVGKGTVIGAGSTITDDVEDFSLAIARSKQVVMPGWALKNGKYKKGL